MRGYEIKEEKVACIIFRIAEHQTCIIFPPSFVTQDSELMNSSVFIYGFSGRQ